MPLVRPFRDSLYLTLALAIVSNGVAGADLLPETPFITIFALLLLGVAYWLEGRWELNLRAANLVGLFLASFLGLWFIYQLVRPAHSFSDVAIGPEFVLAYLAPVVMVLIPAKLFRPKHDGDYWAMHMMGLVAMAVACATAQEGAFVVLFAAYCLAFVWSLTTFCLFRDVGAGNAELVGTRGGRFTGLKIAILATSFVVLVAIPLFWVTPRSGQKWELGFNYRNRALTGLGDGPVDLNRGGNLEANREKAFEVRIETVSGEPYTSLPSDVHWRVTPVQQYEKGRWRISDLGSAGTNLNIFERASSPARRWASPREGLPDLGPDALLLSYQIELKTIRGWPLLAPVAWKAGENSPAVAAVGNDEYQAWVPKSDGNFAAFFPSQLGLPRYAQTWVNPKKPGYAPATHADSATFLLLTEYPAQMTRLRQYADNLMQRFVEHGKLPPEVFAHENIDPVTGAKAPRFHEAIARLMEEHLASSGEFTYTTELKRQDKKLDATEDFVLNTKEGSCRWFASALALLLRTQGIPCVVVLGYRGCENHEDGTYTVREDHAHAWVEALIPASPTELAPVPEHRRFERARVIDWQPVRWLLLDPTPLGDEAATTEKTFLSQTRKWWDAITRSFVLAYDAEARQKALEAAKNWLWFKQGWVWLVAVSTGCLGLLRAVRWWRKRRRYLAEHPPLLRTLLVLAGKRGFVLHLGETLTEFASRLQTSLQANPQTVAFAALPAQLIGDHYAKRFGQQAPDSTMHQQLLTSLRQLARVWLVK